MCVTTEDIRVLFQLIDVLLLGFVRSVEGFAKPGRVMGGHGRDDKDAISHAFVN